MFIFQGIIKPGDLITLMFFSFFLFNPLQELGNVIATYNETKASMDNFGDLMNAKSEEKPPHPKTIGLINNLRFSDISFKHQTASTYAVKDISFEAKAGETIAFVGPSGSGKTTLVKMLVGLYTPEDGAIFYNEINAKDIDLTELRQQLGFVTQDAQLFSGTIKDNLLFVKPHATDTEINDVLQKSACQNLLDRAEKGLDTTIGEGGIKVSGGEKQRLSIARALLRNPRLLLFDEATSALDSITEEEITQTIRSISSKQDQITVLIAHRLSTIMHADRIYVLEQGAIIEQGKHQDLLDEKGLYYAMWRQQIGERKLV
jgi:ATP-binding cassette subfamily B protein